MYHLFLATLAIILTALATVGGAGYLSTDFGVRKTTSETVVTSYRAFEGAVSAYRISNGGARPRPSSPPAPATNPSAEPWVSVRPYLASASLGGGLGGALVTVPGMDWTYGIDSTRGAYLCLSSQLGWSTPKAVRDGLGLAAERAAQGFVGQGCLDAQPSASPDSPFALTLLLQAGQ